MEDTAAVMVAIVGFLALLAYSIVMFAIWMAYMKTGPKIVTGIVLGWCIIAALYWTLK